MASAMWIVHHISITVLVSISSMRIAFEFQLKVVDYCIFFYNAKCPVEEAILVKLLNTHAIDMMSLYH